MEKYLKITRNPYEEPYHINLIFEASNGEQSGILEIYDSADILKECAKALENFPRHSTDIFLWELGSERPEDNFAFYFRFRVFLLDSAGHCCIQIRLNNNEDFPDKAITKFCINCEPADINRLGKLMKEFSELKTTKLYWDSIDGKLN